MKYKTIEEDTDYNLFHILFRIEFSFYGTIDVPLSNKQTKNIDLALENAKIEEQIHTIYSFNF